MRRHVVKVSDALFFMPYVLMIICSFYTTTTFPAIFSISRVILLARFFMIGMTLFKIVMVDTFSLKQLIWLLLLVGMTGIIYLYSSRGAALADVVLLIISSKGIDEKEIVNCYFKISIVLIVITLISCQLGIIIDWVTVRGITGVKRHSFGFVYATDFAAHIFFTYLSFKYLCPNKRNKFVGYLIEGLLLVGVVIFIDINCDARLSEIMLLLTYLSFLLLDLGVLRFDSSLVRLLCKWSMPICAIFTVMVTLRYNASNKLWSILDSVIFSGRLRISKKVITDYGISLFGKNIDMQGLGYKVHGFDQSLGTTYLDSSYIQIMMIYGVLFLIILMILFVVMAKESLYLNNYNMGLVLFLISLSCIMNQYLIRLAYNPFILFIGPLAIYKSRLKQVNEW